MEPFKKYDAIYNERRKSKHTFPDRKLYNILAKKCFKTNYFPSYDEDARNRKGPDREEQAAEAVEG